MTREPPRPRIATTLVGIEDETANGHAPETSPPAPPRLRAMRFSTEEQVDRHDAQLDAVLDDTRFLRQWTERADEQFTELRSGQDRLELGLFEVLGLVKRADERAGRAERESKAARDEAGRASQTNEIVVDHAKHTLANAAKKQDLELDAEQKRIARRDKWATAVRVVVRKVSEHGLSALLVGIVTYVLATKGCHP